MPTIQIEETLHEALKETDLLAFQHQFAIERQLTKIEHFEHVTDEELKSYGLSAPAVRRLRNALDRRKRAKKSKLFSKPKASRFISADCDTPTTSTPPTSQPSTSTTPMATPCLISHEDVKLMEKLGEGSFATVKRGVWQRPGSLVKMDCAVKILNQMSDQGLEDMHAEIAHMQKLNHQNVIKLYGIVFGEPTMLILEFCDGGSLLDRLRNTKKPVLLVTKLLGYALQIASGMAYLENRHVIHRDLALRNILLADNEEVIKICDFGLTRSLEENERLYVMSGQKKVPFSWCPPESLRFRQFSHKSDCWAFGVSLWELYTYGEEPWAGHRAADVLRMTENGEQLKKPRKCLQEIYEIMQMCWNLESELRPKFSHLRNLLLDIKFMTAETRESFINEDPESLELSVGDHVIIISEHAQKEWWYGQCISTRKFGKFPYSLVSIRSNRVSNNPTQTSTISSPSSLAAMSSSTYQPNSNSRISKPILGSLIHTGHGDLDQDKCWGHVERIDEIYLKNPVIRPPAVGIESRSHGVSFISSITALHEDILSTPNSNAKVRPTTSNPIKLDFDPLKAWDMPSAPAVSSKPTNMPTRPPPPVAKPQKEIPPNAFDSLKSEYEKLKAERTKSGTASSKYDRSLAIPRPKGGSPSDELANSSTTPPQPANIIPGRNQTQPILLPSAIKPQPERLSLEDDPFIVDPNLRNLTLKSQPPDPISWRQPALGVEQIQRPQSARLNETFSVARKPEPLDQSLLALLDPLLSRSAKAVSPAQSPNSPSIQATKSAQKSSNTPSQPSTKIKQPPVNTNRTQVTASVPRPQSTSNLSTAPSALNVLAFVSGNREKSEASLQKLTTHQQQQPTEKARQPASTTSGWTYLPPSAVVSTTSLNKGPATSGTANKTSTPTNTTAIITTTTTSKDQPRPLTTNISVKRDTPAATTSAPKITTSAEPIASQSNSLPKPTSSFLPPPSELAVPTTSAVSSALGSLLPPPSELLLSGLKKDAQWNGQAAKSSDSAYGSLTSNSSITRSAFQTNNLLLGDSIGIGSMGLRADNKQTPHQLFNIQNSNSTNFNGCSSAYFMPQTSGAISSAPSMIITQSNQPLNQGGIPFLLPTPFQPTPKPTPTPNDQSKAAPMINLNDLDIDRMIEQVKSKADFASVDQCSKALRTSNYEIEEAIQRLKVEKLLEMGLCQDRTSAFQTLVRADWNVNEAAIQLIS